MVKTIGRILYDPTKRRLMMIFHVLLREGALSSKWSKRYIKYLHF